jgi:hypothetical protein
MLLAVFGEFGSGKTLYLVWLAYMAMKNKIPIYSNFHLNIPYNKLTLKDLVSFKLEKAIILLDEGYLYADSRRSMDPLNVDISNFMMQTRKRHLHAAWSFQDPTDTEKRLRGKAHFYILCNKDVDGFHYTVMKKQSMVFSSMSDTPLRHVRDQFLSWADAEKLFPLYNTYELIPIDDIKKERQSIKDERKDLKKRLSKETNKKAQRKEAA